ncbi:MAG: hypothetical protein IJI05_00800 [Erysipelotrichaceae bacterium]|nr:hypothetical protein [Erysipelotrichaceae bacterium]
MRFLVALIQITWGLPQTLIGFFLFLLNIHRKHYWFRNSIVTEWRYDNSCSLGLFIFIDDDSYDPQEVLLHEYGHCIQSLYLGPLYLLVIGIPSFLWCNLPVFSRRRRKRHISYYSFYPERWANRLSERHVLHRHGDKDNY